MKHPKRKKKKLTKEEIREASRLQDHLQNRRLGRGRKVSSNPANLW